MHRTPRRMRAHETALTARPRLAPLGWLLFFLLYTSVFWGNLADRILGDDGWSHALYGRVGPLWEGLLGEAMLRSEAIALLLCVESYLLAGLVPILVLRHFGWAPSSAGLGAPRPGTCVAATAIAAPTLLLGVGLGLAAESRWGTPLYEALELAAMVPEHFLIFGVAMSLMQRQVDAAMPTEPGGRARASRAPAAGIRSWDPCAMGGATALFAAAHSGHSLAELMLSLPVGALFALSTAWAGSIWPAVVMHWMLNLGALGAAVVLSGSPERDMLAESVIRWLA